MLNKIAFVLILGTCLGQGQPFDTNSKSFNGKAFKNPMEIKQVILACDVDKDGELSTTEMANCVSEGVVNYLGDGLS